MKELKEAIRERIGLLKKSQAFSKSRFSKAIYASRITELKYVLNKMDAEDNIDPEIINLYKSIVDCIQEQVNDVATQWSQDQCPPFFLVSVGKDGGNRDILMLTVTHSNKSFTEVLFPREDSHYGYDSIHSMMKNMYNRTM